MPEDQNVGLQAALRASAASVAWTVVSSTLAVRIGVHDRSSVLVAFGAIGVVDAIGSIALVHHFRHAIHHDAADDRLEALAHKVILAGLTIVGLAAIAAGGLRLAAGSASESSTAGIALAASSLVALSVLSARKQYLARHRVDSPALRSDGHLSAVGATLAAVTLAGTAVTRAYGWSWADAVATIVVGATAIGLAITTRNEHF